MTRLQRMFIELSQCKTVDDLEKALSPRCVDDLFAHLAFDEEGKVHTCGHFPSCCGCTIGCKKSNLSPAQLTVDYLNEELDASYRPQNTIISVRDRAIEYLKKKFDIAKKNNANPVLTGMALDELCNMLEGIGLFESNECHDMLLKATNRRTKK